jgi:hypothetical protein
VTHGDAFQNFVWRIGSAARMLDQLAQQPNIKQLLALAARQACGI